MKTWKGQTPTDEYVEEMIAEAPGSINFTMFLTLMGEKLNGMWRFIMNNLQTVSLHFDEKGTDPEQEIIDAFECFDDDNTGFIDAEELREFLTTMGDRFTDDEVDIMFKGSPVDAQGRFNYREFVRVLKHGE